MSNPPLVGQPKSPGPTAAGVPAPNQCDPSSGQQLLDLMNQERAKRGIPPLQVDPRLNQAAAKHTEVMVARHALSHQFDDEPPIATRFSNENPASGQEGENIGYALNVASEHKNLMESSDHRANILNADYNVVGMCAVRSGGELWITQDFARIAPVYSASQADAAIQEAINRYVQAQGMPPPERKP